MGSPSGAAPTYTGQSLPNQSAGAFTQGLNTASGMVSGGADYANQAGGLFNQFGGMMPSDVSTQGVNQTDLSGYMNAFQSNVIDTTMGELNRQEAIQGNLNADQFLKSNAFGGDREAIYNAESNRNFDDTRAKTLAQLNTANFGNAQQMAQTDLARKLQADSANQNMRYGMSQAGASGLSGLGTQGLSTGFGGLSNMANLGFGMSNQLAQNQLAAGEQQRQIMQSLIDAAKQQYSGWTGSPEAGLESMIKALGLDIGGAGSSKTKTDSSTWEKVLGGVEAIGSFF